MSKRWTESTWFLLECSWSWSFVQRRMECERSPIKKTLKIQRKRRSPKASIKTRPRWWRARGNTQTSDAHKQIIANKEWKQLEWHWTQKHWSDVSQQSLANDQAAIST